MSDVAVEPALAPVPPPGRRPLVPVPASRIGRVVPVPRVPVVQVSRVVHHVLRDGTKVTERVMPPVSKDPIIRAAQAAREAQIDRALREDNDVRS